MPSDTKRDKGHALCGNISCSCMVHEALNWAIERAEERADSISSISDAERAARRLRERAEIFRRLRDRAEWRAPMAEQEAGRGEGRNPHRSFAKRRTNEQLARLVEVVDIDSDVQTEVAWPAIRDEIARRLRESDPGGELVAYRWRFQNDDDDAWRYRSYYPEVPNAEVQPVYAHPAASTDEAPVPKLRNETIDAIEATVIRETGNGPLAGVVSSFLRSLRALQGEGDSDG